MTWPLIQPHFKDHPLIHEVDTVFSVKNQMNNTVAVSLEVWKDGDVWRNSVNIQKPTDGKMREARGLLNDWLWKKFPNGLEPARKPPHPALSDRWCHVELVDPTLDSRARVTLRYKRDGEWWRNEVLLPSGEPSIKDREAAKSILNNWLWDKFPSG